MPSSTFAKSENVTKCFAKHGCLPQPHSHETHPLPRSTAIMKAFLELIRCCNSCLIAVCLATLPLAGAEKNSGKDKPSPGSHVTFLPEGGVFSDAIAVALKSDRAGASIRFTLNGTEPNAKSETYGRELRLTATTLVLARAFDGDKPAGPVVSQTYTVIERELEKFTSSLPLVILNTFGHEIEKARKIPGSVRVIAPENGRSSFTRAASLDGRGDLNLRGHSSLRYMKRSFSLKTRDDDGRSRSVSILGLPSDNEWVLYAPYPDKTLIRDVLAYDLSRQMGRYASRTRFVELFLNQVGGKLSKRHHMGVYVLEEKIRRGKDRVNIQKLSTNDNAEPNITGGYIFKKDHWDDQGQGNERPTVEGRPNNGFGMSSTRYGYPTGPGGFPGDPKGFLPTEGGERRNGRKTQSPDAINRGVLDDIRNALGGGNNPPPGNREPTIIRDGRGGFRQFEGASGSESFRTSQGNEFIYVEPKADEITAAQKNWLRTHVNEFERVLHSPGFADPAKGYAAYIDVDSFIDHHILVESTKNIDGFRFSTFFQKDRGGKIKMEPIWDWNLSMGNANGKQGWMSEYWYWPQLDDNQYSYYRRLFEDPDFAQRYVDRWADLRKGALSSSNVMSRVDALVAELGDARVRNFERWPILGRSIWPNRYVGRTYEDEINYLKQFITMRFAWIDRQFVAAPVATRNGAGAITLETAAGTIYFTTDGSDPRAAGGGRSPQAQTYTTAIPMKPGAKSFARVLHENRWSAPVRW